MKTVILAGGFGTRLSEVTDVIPKPMIELGYRPILWNIMKFYAHFGHKDFTAIAESRGLQDQHASFRYGHEKS